jgi:hypothetical protein
MTHMLGMFPNCKWMKDNFHDIFSSLEQEICSLSDTFLYASGSSWSLNIMMERHAQNIRKKKSSVLMSLYLKNFLANEKSLENIALLFNVLEKLHPEKQISRRN